jgi:hypothetical protein
MFAVLSRLRKPNPERFPEALAAVVESLTVFDKLDLYGGGMPPEGIARVVAIRRPR